MTEQQHVPIEDLAAYAAGDLDAAAAVTVEAHVVLCPECRADVEAVRAATSLLASVPAATMPADAAARLDDTLAGLGATPRAPAGTVLPMAPRRSRFSLAGISAVAAAVALGAAVSIPLLTGGGANDSGGTAASAPEAARDLAAKGTRRISSGLDYRRDTLAATLDAALVGARPSMNEDSGGAYSRGSDGGSAPQEAPPAGAPTLLSTASLRTEPARLAACINEIVAGQPPAGRTLLVVDFARFEGRDALVLVFPSVTREGVLRDNRVDVFVVGGGCGTEPGGDVLDFQRIAVPSRL